jgi:hypothetical protein
MGIFLPMSQQPLIIEASRSHSDAPHSVGILWMNDQLLRRNLYLTKHNNHQSQTSMSTGGIRTHNPSEREVEDTRLRQRGDRDRPTTGIRYFNLRKADPSGRAVYGVGLRPLACWDCGFESRQGHGCLSHVNVCCQVEVSATE